MKLTINDIINDISQKMYDFGNKIALDESKDLIPKKGIALGFEINLSKNVNASVQPILLNTGSLGYKISLNRGLIYNLYILASALLSKSSVMPDLGENEIEFAEGTISLDEIEWGNDLDAQIEELSNENVRLCKLSNERHKALHHIIWGAFLFAYFHEIGHARRAHANWYYKITQDALAEDRDTYFLKAISSQALELSADAHASLVLAGIIIGSKDKIELARYYGFGVGLLLETFDTVFTPLSDYNDSSHPHPGVRFMYTSSGFAGRALKYGINLSPEVQKSFEKGFTEAAFACMSINSEIAISELIKSPEKVSEINSKLGEILDELDRISLEYIPKWLW